MGSVSYNASTIHDHSIEGSLWISFDGWPARITLDLPSLRVRIDEYLSTCGARPQISGLRRLKDHTPDTGLSVLEYTFVANSPRPFDDAVVQRLVADHMASLPSFRAGARPFPADQVKVRLLFHDKNG